MDNFEKALLLLGFAIFALVGYVLAHFVVKFW